MEQTRSDPGFQARHRTAHPGRRDANGVGGPRKAAAFHDCGEDRHAGEETPVERHELAPLLISTQQYEDESAL